MNRLFFGVRLCRWDKRYLPLGEPTWLGRESFRHSPPPGRGGPPGRIAPRERQSTAGKRPKRQKISYLNRDQGVMKQFKSFAQFLIELIGQADVNLISATPQFLEKNLKR